MKQICNNFGVPISVKGKSNGIDFVFDLPPGRFMNVTDGLEIEIEVHEQEVDVSLTEREIILLFLVDEGAADLMVSLADRSGLCVNLNEYGRENYEKFRFLIDAIKWQ